MLAWQRLPIQPKKKSPIETTIYFWWIINIVTRSKLSHFACPLRLVLISRVPIEKLESLEIWTFQRTINRHSIYLFTRSFFLYFIHVDDFELSTHTHTHTCVHHHNRSKKFRIHARSFRRFIANESKLQLLCNLKWAENERCDEQNWCYWWQPMIKLKNEVETVYSFGKWNRFCLLEKTCAKTKQINWINK